MLEKLAEIEKRYASLEERLGSPDVASDHQESTKIHRAMREIAPVVEKVRELRKAQDDLAGAREMLDTLPAGDELRAMAEAFGFNQDQTIDIAAAASRFPTELDKSQAALSAIASTSVPSEPASMRCTCSRQALWVS